MTAITIPIIAALLIAVLCIGKIGGSIPKEKINVVMEITKMTTAYTITTYSREVVLVMLVWRGVISSKFSSLDNFNNCS